MAVERLDTSESEDLLQVALHRARYDFVLDRTKQATSVLEIGTGVGTLAETLLSRSVKYTGVDFDPAAVEITRQRTQGRANVMQADARNLPFRDREFSDIVCLEVLEHLGNFSAGVREIHRCLDKGGQAIISVPWRRIGGKSRTNVYHIYEPGEAELVAEFRRLFRAVEVFYQYYEETPLVTLVRLLHLRRFFKLDLRYKLLSEGHPSELARLGFGSHPRGMRLGLTLVASDPK